MSYSFDNSCPSIFTRNGSWAGRRETRWAKERSDPHNLLYLEDKGLGTTGRSIVRSSSLVVVLPVLDVVSSHDFYLAKISILFPLKFSEQREIAEGGGRTFRKSTFLSNFCSWCLNCLTIVCKGRDCGVRVRSRACELGSVFQPISAGPVLPSSSSSPALRAFPPSLCPLFASASFSAFVANPQTLDTRVRTPTLSPTDTRLVRPAIHIVIS